MYTDKIKEDDGEKIAAKEEKRVPASVEDALKRLNQELVVAGYSKKTREAYALYTKDFLEFAKKAPESMDRSDIVAYLADLKEKRNSANATLALALSSLKYFFNNVIRKKIVDEIKSPKKGKYLPTVLTKDEIKALLKEAGRGRDRLIIEFLYSSGVRVSECVSMKVSDLNLKEHIARVRSGKGNKDRVIILSNTWVSDLKRHLKKRKAKTEYVFSKKNGKPISTDTVQRIIRMAAGRAGITKKVTPHSLRHSFATHLLDGGENIRKIQELLGHSNLNTTQIYTKISTESLKKVKSPFDNM